jgi:hypothetical protein
MPNPDISPILAQIGGDDYLKTLKARLTELADQTDDPAYASRLREVANGTRPLRTLAMDPAWNKQFKAAMSVTPVVPELDPDQRAAFGRRVEELRQHSRVPTNPEEAGSFVREVLQRAERTRQINRQDELAGWDHIPDEPSSNATGS